MLAFEKKKKKKKKLIIIKVPITLIDRIAGLAHGGTKKSIGNLSRYRLLHHDNTNCKFGRTGTEIEIEEIINSGEKKKSFNSKKKKKKTTGTDLIILGTTISLSRLFQREAKSAVSAARSASERNPIFT